MHDRDTSTKDDVEPTKRENNQELLQIVYTGHTTLNNQYHINMSNYNQLSNKKITIKKLLLCFRFCYPYVTCILLICDNGTHEVQTKCVTMIYPISIERCPYRI